MKSLFRSHEPSTFRLTNFSQKPWICKLKIIILCDDMEYDLSQNLALLLNLRRLQRVDIKIFDKTVERGQVNPVERTIQTIADVYTQIRAKIGKGLTVRVQKDWAENSRPGHGDYFLHNPILESISWMWEEPSDEARARVQQGSGRHRECI